ncbi:MAG: nitrite/sulfite reductase [Acidobacteria bacterium]|nr:nitrite/sulfite reductase [Acidobacteriota bacterium]
MKASNHLWKEQLAGKIAEPLNREIDIFETEIDLRRQGKVDERVFAETRLRRGVYGQRYDNGQRHDGKVARTLEYPTSNPTKGPNTVWDAPGMQRIKIPYGGLNAAQLEVMAELAEEYSDGIAHVTTRQDFQLHFVHMEDTPTLMRRLAAVGITTREACGNSVRNVTACPFSGVCPDEAFDVTPYAKALSRFLLGHPDCQNFGRKFKPALSGCSQHACGLTSMHDLGAIAVTRRENGVEARGFELYVGGGLGAVPYQAKLFDEFLLSEQLLPTAQAIARVFARLGEKKNRARARIKFLVHDLGIEKFKALVLEERDRLPRDPRWKQYLDEALAASGEESPTADDNLSESGSPEFQQWLKTNVRPQKQTGFVVATVSLPLGDISSDQLRALADIARRFTPDTVRTTVEQNIVLRWVRESDLAELFQALESAQLARPGASNIVDVVACPGTDTCKLGISSSRGLAAELQRRLADKGAEMDQAIQDLHIKVSGCFNSCGQHHVADMGFYGVSRKVGGFAVPHFQVVLGGRWDQNAGSYGLPIVAIPSKNVPEVVSRLGESYVRDRNQGESFQDFVKRTGKLQVRKLLEDLAKVPGYEADSSYFSDWGDPREYSISDIGKGECAGEVVSAVEFDLAAAERQVFEAQVFGEGGDFQKAGETAYGAMLHAARGLIKIEFLDVSDDRDEIVKQFRIRYFDTRKIFDPFAGPKFANYLFAAHRSSGNGYTPESSRRLIEEAHLFIEACHGCFNRMGLTASAATA